MTTSDKMARTLTKVQRTRVALKRARSEDADEAHRGFLLLLAELDKIENLISSPSLAELEYTHQEMLDEMYLVIRKTIKNKQPATAFERRVYIEGRRHFNAKLLAKRKKQENANPTPIAVDGVYIFYDL